MLVAMPGNGHARSLRAGLADAACRWAAARVMVGRVSLATGRDGGSTWKLHAGPGTRRAAFRLPVSRARPSAGVPNVLWTGTAARSGACRPAGWAALKRQSAALGDSGLRDGPVRVAVTAKESLRAGRRERARKAATARPGPARPGRASESRNPWAGRPP